MKACVIRFPASNCDAEALQILQNFGFDADFVWHEDDLPKVDLCFIPGGFSYGDYLRTGALAALSKIMGQVKAHADSGRYLIGVCNGFQILTEAKLLPGALMKNHTQSFICKVVELQTVNKSSIFSCDVENTIRLQIAHGEGRYYADDDAIKKLQDEGKIAFKYTENVNGSIQNIAGILGGKNNNILGMMPHPERTIAENVNGSQIFASIVKHLQ